MSLSIRLALRSDSMAEDGRLRDIQDFLDFGRGR